MKNKIWKGRIKKSTDKEVEDFTSSIKSDIGLYIYDITGTAAYSAGLFKIGIIKKGELEKIFYGLKKIKMGIEGCHTEYHALGHPRKSAYIEHRLLWYVPDTLLYLL